MSNHPLGYCPVCGAIGVKREKRPDGNDVCANGHTYPSRSALPEPLPDDEDEDAFTAESNAEVLDLIER